MSLQKASRWFPKFEKDLPDVTGKVFVITGTTSGTGYVAARVAAQKGGDVVLLNRKSQRSVEMLENLRKDVPNAKFVSVECDLQSFDSVRKAVQEIKSKYTSIYCLCNNAGIMATPDRATVDGYDEQIQTNHLSHFLLSLELLPLLKKSQEARIVNHSSMARDNCKAKPKKLLDRKYFEKTGGDGNLGGDEYGMMSGPAFERYCQSKLANSVFTHALVDKLGDTTNIKVLTAHPGASTTALGEHLKFGWFMNILVKYLFYPLLTQSSEDGSMGILRCMMDPSVKMGTLYGPKGMKGPAIALEPHPWETDEASKLMLWETSLAATGVTFSS